jgi:polyferredoxin
MALRRRERWQKAHEGSGSSPDVETMTLTAEIVLAPIAAGMAATTAYLLRWAAEARTPLRASTVVFLLLMMVAMVAGAAVYYARPSSASLVEGFWVASALMSVSVVQVFAGFLEEVRLRASGGPSPANPALRHTRTFAGAVIALVLVNELLMGWTFQAAAGQPIAVSGAGLDSLAGTLALAVNSPWFLFTMSAEMLLTAWFLRARLPRPAVIVLVTQSVIMLLSPPALPFATWVNLSVYLASALMIGLFVYVMEYLYRHPELPRSFASYLVRLLGVYAVMMAGLYLWFVGGNPYGFALSVVLEMLLFFDLIVRPERLDAADRIAWHARPNWTFSVLALVFVSELFMGALLDTAVLGGTFAGSLPTLPLAGSAGTVLYNGFYNGFWFVALTTGSTWFLAMMGVEMGALVAFKFRETRNRETRVRLALMMVCYGAFAVFFPSIYYPLVFPALPSGTNVPVLGWSMGIGSAPLAIGVFGVLLMTYAVLGSLTFLFGRRVVCSTFCTAPLMYQGTAIDSMKSFNHSSPTARKFLSSRFSATYTTATSVVMVSLVLASVASYLDQVGVLSVTVLGADPTVFLFAFYFSVLWYALFIAIPYAGNYNCVTMGWCYTGAVAQLFSRIGFFRLKVYDRNVCRSCTTMDCARACPVGLVDMPGHFRQKGEFRSSKCCGVGDCVEACPYGNMYYFDVRDWIRGKVGAGARRRPTLLPMVGTRSLVPPFSSAPPVASPAAVAPSRPPASGPG